LAQYCLVLVRASGRGKGSGIEIEAPVAHLWTMRDGRGVMVQMFSDRAHGTNPLAPGGRAYSY
jgi:ketosteroid isomerase-like protein